MWRNSLQLFELLLFLIILRSENSHSSAPDTVTDFSWEPRGERFAVVSSSDPNIGNAGPGVTIKTDVSFYQLERGRGDFKLLSMFFFVLFGASDGFSFTSLFPLALVLIVDWC